MIDSLPVPAVLALISSFIVTCMARYGGVLDFPETRSMHSKPTPRSGGLGIMAGVGVGAIMLISVPFSASQLSIILGFATVLGLIGLLDDLYALGSKSKFAGMAGLCLIAVVIVEPVTRLSVTSTLSLEVGLILGIIGSTLFLFTVINATNFMDGSDGMLVAVMIPAGLGLMVAGMVAGVLSSSLTGLLLAAACAGFAVWNIPPARVFAGDAGSLFAGSLYALGALVIAGKGFPGSLWLAPLFVLMFLADVLLTLLRRLRYGRLDLNAHSEHAYQRLIKSGWSHAQVAWLYSGMTSLIVLTSLIASQGPEFAPFAMFVIWSVGLTACYVWVGRYAAHRGVTS